jgi:biopolymer transport protein TolR
MRTTVWRPSTALRKRRSSYLSLLDVTGVAGIFFFFVAMYMALIGTPDRRVGPDIDLPATEHPQLLPGALKEDALVVYLTRNGSIYLRSSRVGMDVLPRVLRDGYRSGSERKVYFRADARAKYGDVKAVLDQISAAGKQDVAFITEQREYEPVR